MIELWHPQQAVTMANQNNGKYQCEPMRTQGKIDWAELLEKAGKSEWTSHDGI